MEETKLHKIQEQLRIYEDNLKEFQNVEVSIEMKNKDIDGKIEYVLTYE